MVFFVNMFIYLSACHSFRTKASLVEVDVLIPIDYHSVSENGRSQQRRRRLSHEAFAIHGDSGAISGPRISRRLQDESR